MKYICLNKNCEQYKTAWSYTNKCPFCKKKMANYVNLRCCAISLDESEKAYRDASASLFTAFVRLKLVEENKKLTKKEKHELCELLGLFYDAQLDFYEKTNNLLRRKLKAKSKGVNP